MQVQHYLQYLIYSKAYKPSFVLTVFRWSALRCKPSWTEVEKQYPNSSSTSGDARSTHEDTSQELQSSFEEQENFRARLNLILLKEKDRLLGTFPVGPALLLNNYGNIL